MENTLVKKVIALYLCVLASCFAATAQICVPSPLEPLFISNDKTNAVYTAEGIDLRNLGSGYVSIKNFRQDVKHPDYDLSVNLKLPRFMKMSFSAADATYSDKYPYNSNRLNPWITEEDFSAEFEKTPAQDAVYVGSGKNGQYALLKLHGHGYLALLPLTGSKTTAWLHAGKDNVMSVRVANFGTSFMLGEVPVIAWATDDNPYEAVRKAWKTAASHPDIEGKFRFIEEKPYPEMFSYLGWCSWEQYKKDLYNKLLVDTIDKLNSCGVPVRWMLVDDGFQNQDSLRLKSFEPNLVTFPNAWEKIMAKRDPYRVKWFGLWNCFYGLWEGIDNDNSFGELNKYFIKVDDETLIPGASKFGAELFYDAFMQSAKNYGFDFVKVDVQSGYVGKIRHTPNAVERAVWCSQALENAAGSKFGGALINCMAQNGMIFFNAKNSSVMRVSVDYFKGKPNTAKSHLYQSYHNTIWLSNIYWPDHDMFHSSDKTAAMDMAISKAISGGPVYLSDDPNDFNHELAKALCFDDGMLLRPLAPAVPTPESIFDKPLANAKNAYRVIAPLKNGAVAVMMHNLSQVPDKNPQFRAGMSLTSAKDQVDADPVIPQKAWVDLDDYKFASSMVRPTTEEWSVPERELIWFDWHEQKGGVLRTREEFTITKPLQGKLILLVPVRQGWGFVGLSKKFLSPVSVDYFEIITNDAYLAEHCVIKFRDPGEFVIYLDGGKPLAKGIKFEYLGNNFWKGVTDLTCITVFKGTRNKFDPKPYY